MSVQTTSKIITYILLIHINLFLVLTDSLAATATSQYHDFHSHTLFENPQMTYSHYLQPNDALFLFLIGILERGDNCTISG